MRDGPERRVAIGFFDGVHVGHQRILRGVDEVVTFSRHPLSVVAGGECPPLLMTLDERLEAIRRFSGGAEVKVLDFDDALAALPARDFAERYLSGKTVRCGRDWRFGRGGEGNADFLRKLGWIVESVDDVELKGEKVSSSRIRRALSEGDVGAVSAMMARVFTVKGAKCTGKGEGAALGFATLNLAVRGIPLRRGVYEVFACGRSAVANYGVAPTMGERAWKEPVLEVHFLDGGGAEGEVEVEFLRFIRDERTFGGMDSLKAQLAEDCREVERSRPLLSVVVTTKNEEENIANCISSFDGFRDRVEVIVVDNASTDLTKPIAAAAGARVFDRGPERSAQRNLGWRSARAGVVAVLDADMQMPRETVEEMLECAKKGGDRAWWIPEVRTGGTWRVKVRNFERSFYDGTCIDALRLFSKGVLERTGGYDEGLLAGPEDWELDIRVLASGAECSVLKGHLLHNEKSLTYAKMLSKKAYYTKSFAAYKAKWPGHPAVRRQFSPWYRFVGVFVERGKWRKVLRHPILFTGVLFERLSVGLVYLFAGLKRKEQS